MSCCTCSHREYDPDLYDLYTQKLLEPGWGGELAPSELAYKKAQLNTRFYSSADGDSALQLEGFPPLVFGLSLCMGC